MVQRQARGPLTLVTCGICNDYLGERSKLCGKREFISMAAPRGACREKVVVPEANIVEITEVMKLVKGASGDVQHTLAP